MAQFARRQAFGAGSMSSRLLAFQLGVHEDKFPRLEVGVDRSAFRIARRLMTRFCPLRPDGSSPYGAERPPLTGRAPPRRNAAPGISVDA